MRMLRKFQWVLVCNALLGLSAGAALGQRGGVGMVGHSGGSMGGGGGTSGGGGGGGGIGGVGGMNNGGGGGVGGGTIQVNPALVADQQQIGAASLKLQQIQSALDSAQTKATNEFHKTPDYSAAVHAADEAAKTMQKARDAVMGSLKQQADYKAAADKETAARKKLEALKANGADADEINTQSLEILKIGGQSSKLERDALEADAPYKAAMKRLADAHDAVKSMDEAFRASLQADANIAALVQHRDDARNELATAQAKFRADESGG